MTFRERIADWISGGALTASRTAHAITLGIQKLATHDNAVARSRLDRIIAEGENAICDDVKRMARIARGLE